MTSNLRITGCAALGMLALPLALTVPRAESIRAFVRDVEHREQQPWPRFDSARDALDAKRWEQAGRALADRFPLRDVVIPAKARIDHDWLQKRRFGAVERGRDGWLFLRASYDPGPVEPKHLERTAETLLNRLEDYVVRHRGRRARLLVLVAPDKAALYPDRLGAQARARFEAFRPARESVQARFRGSPHPELLDLWSLYRDAQARSPVPLYERLGTHHTRAAALLLARAIVDAAQPGVWDEGSVVSDPDGPALADLAVTAGLGHLEETTPQAHVERTGVALEGFWLEGERTSEDPAELLASWDAWGKPVHAESGSGGPPLIPGDVLVVHDSFLGTCLRPALWPYFERVSFLHHVFVSAAELERAFDDYDLIVLEVVERDALGAWNRLLKPVPPGEAAPLRAKLKR